MTVFKKSVLVLIIITSLGFSLRIWKLTTSPAGLYIDETSIGYNAFSLITTGRDEHGKFLPLFFEAFGEYKLPIYIYLVAITQLFTGPTDLSVRLPAVIFGTLTIPLIYLFSRELLRNNSNQTIKNFVPLLSAFLLATSPWHIQFTRPGFEASAGLFFLTLGLFAFYKAINKGSVFILSIAFVSFVLALYSYTSARVVIPIVTLSLIVLYSKNFSVTSWSKALLTGFIFAIPFITFASSPAGLARARQISIFYQPTVYPIYQQFFYNYLENISPYYLFVRGDPTIAHATPHRMSLIYPIEFPFFVIGFWALVKLRSRYKFLILMIFFIGFIPPALAMAMPWYQPHALRALMVLPASIFISAYGFSYLISKFKREHVRQVYFGIYILTLCFFTITFLDIYHNKYAIDAGRDWQVDAKRVSLEILQIQDDYNEVYFSSGLNGVALAWYLKFDPALYQSTTDKLNLGKYHLGVDSLESLPKNGRNIYVTASNVPGGRLLKYTYFPNSKTAFGVWVI